MYIVRCFFGANKSLSPLSVRGGLRLEVHVGVVIRER